MKVKVVYDSYFGNTEQVARAMAGALGSEEDVALLRVGEVTPEQLMASEVLIVGSPTRKFRPTAATSDLLKSIPGKGLKGVKVAAFDTRIPEADIKKNRVLAVFVRIFGYAAKPIADRLVKKGGELALAPEGFLVLGVEGPLAEGELERAADWARRVSAAP